MPIRSAKTTDDDTIRVDTRNRWFNLTLIGLCFVALLGVRLQTNEPTTGDEPHYLIMDYALVHDHTFNLKNVYDNDEYIGFYPVRGLPPQGNPKLDSLSSPAIYSPHGIGLPLLLFPGFAAAAQTGAMLEMVALATLVICLTWWWALVVTQRRKIAYLAAGSLAICYFFNGLAGYVYPDMVVAAATLAGLIMAERYVEGLRPQILFGLVLALLIFLHIKELVIALPLLLIFGYKLWRARRR